MELSLFVYYVCFNNNEIWLRYKYLKENLIKFNRNNLCIVLLLYDMYYNYFYKYIF